MANSVAKAYYEKKCYFCSVPSIQGYLIFNSWGNNPMDSIQILYVTLTPITGHMTTINFILQVRGKDQVGATMDFMELERQRGITIQV